MRHFMIRAFEVLILLICGVSALLVLAATTLLVANNASLSQFGISGYAPDRPNYVWVEAAILMGAGFGTIILVGGGALTLTGIYRKLTKLVELVDATPVD